MTTRYEKQQKKYKEEEQRKKAKNSSVRIDKKSIIYIVLLFCFFAMIGFVVMVDFRGYLIRHDSNWAVTIGQVQSIEKNTVMSQTKAGNKNRVGYKIKYYYMVDSVEYKQEYISWAAQIDFLRFVGYVKPLDSIEIYYKKKDPKNSYINFNINNE